MGQRIEYRLSDGTELVDDREGAGLADEVAFEHQFKLPAAVLNLQVRRRAEHDVAVAAAVKAGEEPPEPSEDIYARTEWIAFFSWRRFRRHCPDKVADSFEAFVESVESWEVLTDGADEEEDKDGDAAGEVDPTKAALIESGSGLDPTDQDQQPTRQPTSSSPASTGEAS